MKKIDHRYQQLLKSLNFYNGPADGILGPNTKNGVILFQRTNGLVADGIVGQKTIAEFENQLASISDRQNDDDAIYAGVKPYSVWPREGTNSLTRFYGNPGENQTRIQLPYTMVLAWDTSKKVNSIVCNVKVAESLQKVLTRVSNEYTIEEINRHGFNLYGGCLNVRKIRGGNRWSTHAWGIAIDFDPARNGLRTPWNKAYLGRPECQKFVQAFKDEGWYSLGLEKNYDAMHFQAAHR